MHHKSDLLFCTKNLTWSYYGPVWYVCLKTENCCFHTKNYPRGVLGSRTCSKTPNSYSLWKVWPKAVVFLCKIRICLNTAYYWKDYSKIIFKCVNSAMKPNFKVDFAKFYTCGSRERCIKPTEKMPNANFFHFQCNPNST